MTDDNIQERLDAGEPVPEAYTYQVLYDALATDLVPGPDMGFAQRVGRRIKAKRNRASDIQLYISIGLIGLLGLGASVTAALALNKELSDWLGAHLAEYGLVWAFSIVIVALAYRIQYQRKRAVLKP